MDDIDNVVYGLENLGYDIPDMPIQTDHDGCVEATSDPFDVDESHYAIVSYEKGGSVKALSFYPDFGDLETEIPSEDELMESLEFVDQDGVHTAYDDGSYVVEMNGDILTEDTNEKMEKGQRAAKKLTKMHQELC